MDSDIEQKRLQHSNLEYVFKRGEHTFYDQLLTFLTSFSGNGYSLMVFGALFSPITNWTQLLEMFSLMRLGPLHQAELISHTSKMSLIFYPYDILSSLITNDDFPDEIKLYSKPIKTIQAETERLEREFEGKSSKLQITENFMIQHAFINYYEKYKPKIEELYRKKLKKKNLRSKQWPNDTPWGFGCFIRNCYIHYNGRIHFSDTRLQSISWDGIIICNNQTDLKKPIATKFFSVEAIKLMVDMDRELKQLEKT